MCDISKNKKFVLWKQFLIRITKKTYFLTLLLPSFPLPRLVSSHTWRGVCRGAPKNRRTMDKLRGRLQGKAPHKKSFVLPAPGRIFPPTSAVCCSIIDLSPCLPSWYQLKWQAPERCNHKADQAECASALEIRKV